MEVTHIAHQNTHAVIGGAAPESFGVEANAEFFEMLSSTMYPNKKLAVVREVLANSWDAHLMAGKTDVPVEVMVNDKEIIFKDFGPGISREKIVEIYCTYGKSTKTHDGKQTGGFGLGSKSPFAYSKHFTVTSCHNGERALYAASRGSAETEGRPDFRAMVSGISTDETGITVTIPLQSANDKVDFEHLVRDLAYLGGINCNLNGEKLPTVDYSKSEMPFALLQADKMGRHHSQRSGLYVKYGAVVYPVDTSVSEIQAELEGCSRLRTLRSIYGVVLMAEPNSIGVAPSRETLSYSEKTIQNICALIRDAAVVLTEMEKDTNTAVLAKIKNGILKHGSDNRMKLFRVVSPKNRDRDICSMICNIFCRLDRDIKKPVMTRAALLGLLPNVLLRSFRDTYEASLLVTGYTMENLQNFCFDAVWAADPAMRKYFRQLMNFDRRMESWRNHCTLPNDMMKRAVRLKSRVERDYGVTAELGAAVYSEIVMDENKFILHLTDDLITRREGEYFTRKGPSHYAGFINVFVAPSAAAATRCYQSHRHHIGSESSVMVITVKKSSKTEDLLRDLARFGCKVYDARGYVLKRDPIIPSEKLFLLGTKNKAPVEFDPATSKARFFVYGENETMLKAGEVVVWTTRLIASKPVMTVCNDLVKTEDIVLAVNAADARKLEDLGLKNIHAHLAEKVAALATNPKAVEELFFILTDIPETLKFMVGSNNFDYRSIFEQSNTFPKTTGEISEEEKAILEFVKNFALHTSVQETGRYGAQMIKKALVAIKEGMKTYEPFMEVIKSPHFSYPLDHINSYYLSRSNPAVVTAMISAMLQAAEVQIALAPKPTPAIENTIFKF